MKIEKKAPQTNKRPRGAQPGNSNAVKHGFYSRKFHPQELNDLDLIVMGNLDDEIDMFRVVTRRVFNLLNEVQEEECANALKHWADGLELMGKASGRLAHLLRTQHMIGRSSDEAIETIKAALINVTAELKLND